MRIPPIVLCLLLTYICVPDLEAQEIGSRSRCGFHVNRWLQENQRIPGSRYALPSRYGFPPPLAPYTVAEHRQEQLRLQLSKADVVVVAEFESTEQDLTSQVQKIAVFKSTEILKGLSKDSELEIAYPLTEEFHSSKHPENIFGQALIDPKSGTKTKWILLLKKISGYGRGWQTLNSKKGWIPFTESNLQRVQLAFKPAVFDPRFQSVAKPVAAPFMSAGRTSHEVHSHCQMGIKPLKPMPAHLTKYFKGGSWKQTKTN